MTEKNTVVAVLAGGLRQNPDGSWRTTNLDEGDNFGVIGDRLRVVAAAYLYRANPKLFIIANGGRGQYQMNPNAPTIASVFVNELKQLGVPAEKIIEETKSGTTFKGLQAIIEIAHEKKFANIIIISNRHHLPRIEALYNFGIQQKKIIATNVTFLAAEDILIASAPTEWSEIIQLGYATPEMKKRITLEKNGLDDILAGRYII